MAVAQTRRLHFAKKLIDETTLPMRQIALASGFGCVRRFNENIRKVYRRTPTQIRSLARQREILPGNQYVFRLNFRPPYHWRAVLDFLAARCTPGVETVEGDRYLRTICVNGRHGYFEVSPDGERHLLIARIQFGDPQSLFFIVERIRSMFDLNADWASIVATLGNDPVLAETVGTDPGFRVPGCWNGFELATRAILGQQITVKGANTLAGRLVSKFGKPFRGPNGLTHLFPAPEVLAEAKLGGVGLTGARAATVQAFARAVCEGRINFSGLMDSEAFLNRLCEVPGIGNWTAQYVAMRALGEPDAFPSTDLGLLRATELASYRELALRSEEWRPWRAYAAMYLWRLGSLSPARHHASVSTKVHPAVVENRTRHQHLSERAG
jgi:AraC family transcriptional regulator of adaptative response / DNA-3-methyladenine glycosylase II